MQDQLSSGQSNLQQQNSNLQQVQTNLQQNASPADNSDSGKLLTQDAAGRQLQVQTQGRPATGQEQQFTPDTGVSPWLWALLIVPVLLLLLITSRKPRTQKSSVDSTTVSEPEMPQVEIKPEKPPKSKTKSKNKQTRRKRKNHR